MGSQAWIAANRAMFVPCRIFHPVIITKLWLVNGATASGNFDIGIYSAGDTVDATPVLIVSSGSTAQSGTYAVQTVDITDTEVGAGLYYLALAMNGTTGTCMADITPAAANSKFMGLAQQDTAFALPATATLATSAASILALFGLLLSPQTVI